MTKNPRLGYAKERARFLAGFLVTGMVVVTVLMGMQRVMQNMECDPGSYRCTGYTGSVPAGQYYTLFDIHR